MGGWKNIEDVIGRDAAEGWRQKIESEFSDPSFHNKVMQTMARGQDPLSGHKALIILGPSAAGKSHALKLAGVRSPVKGSRCKGMNFEAWEDKDDFAAKVHAIDMPQRALILDGSYVRDSSDCWRDLVALAHSNDLDGFSDLFSSYFKPGMDKVKKNITKDAIEKQWNIIVPDTASTFKKTAEMIKRLADDGYSLKVVAVYASEQKCKERGKSREKEEGKKYSSKNWTVSMQSIIDTQKVLHDLGLKEEVVLLDNDEGAHTLVRMDSLVRTVGEHQHLVREQASESHSEYQQQVTERPSESQSEHQQQVREEPSENQRKEKSTRSSIAVAGTVAGAMIAFASFRWLRRQK